MGIKYVNAGKKTLLVFKDFFLHIVFARMKKSLWL